jgi:hypothetical protein
LWSDFLFALLFANVLFSPFSVLLYMPCSRILLYVV